MLASAISISIIWTYTSSSWIINIELPPISTSTSSISTCSERKLPEQVELYAMVSSIACCRHNDKSNSNFIIMNYRDDFSHWKLMTKIQLQIRRLISCFWTVDIILIDANIKLTWYLCSYVLKPLCTVLFRVRTVFTMRIISISSSTNNASSKVIALNS